MEWQYVRALVQAECSLFGVTPVVDAFLGEILVPAGGLRIRWMDKQGLGWQSMYEAERGYMPVPIVGIRDLMMERLLGSTEELEQALDWMRTEGGAEVDPDCEGIELPKPWEPVACVQLSQRSRPVVVAERPDLSEVALIATDRDSLIYPSGAYAVIALARRLATERERQILYPLPPCRPFEEAPPDEDPLRGVLG